ncbi:hypothetical protein SAMN05421747_10936 [Parapedobacter composti]|uniref:Uncharacterized protein n=1 Tax=Parapedobacter composti TaxID=623281 RepID=A0A1I1IL48_9SPHI|nr:hypothetical protein SAMN05421747_10936 [Parapedobacter composti]
MYEYLGDIGINPFNRYITAANAAKRDHLLQKKRWAEVVHRYYGKT